MIKAGYTRFLLCFPVMFGLVACGVIPKDLPKDDPLDRTMDVAGQAVFYSRLQQAEVDYKKSYQYALTRDDPVDIENAGYNLAVVQLDMNKLQMALNTIYAVRNQLYVRDQNSSDQLDLVEAAVLYRLHRNDAASRLLRGALQSPDEDIKERAYFFAGLIASDANDLQGLSADSQQMDQLLLKSRKKDEESWKADQGELHALLALKRGQNDEAIDTARYVEVSRRQQVEYRAMVRALAVQALANQAKGNSVQAARLFFRAGKSSALLKEYTDARKYLNQALALHGSKVTDDLTTQELLTVTREETKNRQNLKD